MFVKQRNSTSLDLMQFSQRRYYEISAMDRLLRMKPILSAREKAEEDEKDDDFEGSLFVVVPTFNRLPYSTISQESPRTTTLSSIC